MPVNDHGLEVLKKAAQEATPGDKSAYVLNVKLPDGASPSGGLTDAELRASPVEVTGSFSMEPPETQAVTGPLTNTELRASPIEVTGSLTIDPPDVQTVDGAVSVDNFPATQAVTGSFFQATQPVSLAVAPTTPVTGTFWQTTQPISGTVTATGPITDTQIRATPLPVSGTVTANAGTGTMAVSGPLTDTQIRATALPVSGTFFQATQPVSGTVTANATLAAETTKVIGTVNVAAAQSIAATQSGTWNVTNVSGTVSLPTGASTSALQTTGNTSLSSIDTKLIADSIVATATLSGTATLEISTIGYGTVVAQIGDSPFVTPLDPIAFEATVDGSNWFTLTGSNLILYDGQLPFQAELEGVFGFNVSGMTKMRLRSVTTAPTVCTLRASKDVGIISQIQAVTFVSGSSLGITSSVLPTGAATQTTLAALNAKFSALGQNTMANSAPVVLSSNQTSIPVASTLTAETTKVIGTVNVAAAQTIGVTGTFWQTTQPISGTVTATGPVTDTQIRATPLPVSGTVSATATLAAETTKVIGTVNQGGTWTVQPGNTANTTAWKVDGSAVTQPVSGTVTATGPLTDTQLRATAVPISATNLDVALSTRLKPADTLTGVTTVATVTAVTAITNALPTGANVIGKTSIDQTTPGTTNLVALSAETTKVIGTVNPPALTKATQGANGFTVQNLKDAGRNQTNFWMTIQIVSTATDALMSLTGYKAGAAVVATTTPAVVTSGKTYRITSITMDYTTIVTTPGSVRFTLRANTGGVVAIGSPAVCTWEVGEPTGIAPVAGKKNTVSMTFPDGIEFAAGTGIGISMVGLSIIGAAAVVGYGRITLNGFEY